MKVAKIPLKAMKAKELPFDKLEQELRKKLHVAQLKYDGIRMILTVYDGKPMFRTYNGSIVPLPYMEEKVRQSKLDYIMLDGEFTVEGGRMNTRTTVSGLINSAMHGNRINEKLLSYNLFDSMHIEEFMSCLCDEQYEERYAKTALASLKLEMPLARNTTVHTIEDVNKLSEQLYADGFEGLILKPRNHLYKFTRSPNWIKIKETKTCDLLCIGVTNGTGKYEGMIGALECTGVVEGYNVKVKAGSGMTDYDRSRDPWCYIGATIELKYNTVIMDSVTGDWSLFLPRFKCIRIDK